MGKKWKRLFNIRGMAHKKSLIAAGSLDEFGFESIVPGPNERKCLESMIRSGVPCLRHSAFYLTQWKRLYLDSEYYSLSRS